MLHYRSPQSRRSPHFVRTPRRRIAALVVGVGGILGLLLLGLVLSLLSFFDGKSSSLGSEGEPRDVVTTSDVRDGDHDGGVSSTMAASPARGLGASAVMVLPASTAIGLDRVVTGYPQSAEGAVAQLAAIDVAILREEPEQAARILRAWSLGESEANRARLSAIVRRALPTATRERAELRLATIVRSDSPLRHDVCIAFTRGDEPLRVGPVHCQSMAWAETAWVIDPGQVVGLATGIPQTEAQAFEAGFRRIQGAPSPTSR